MKKSSIILREILKIVWRRMHYAFAMKITGTEEKNNEKLKNSSMSLYGLVTHSDSWCGSSDAVRICQEQRIVLRLKGCKELCK